MLLAASQLLLAASAAGYAGSTARHTSSRKHAAASPASFAVSAAGAQSLPVLSAGTVPGTSAPGMGLWQNGEPARLGPSGPSEFQLNLGRAIDTLRVDHPRLFTHPPDLSIFTEGIELHDVSGAKLRGKAQYERVFGMLRFLRRAAMQHAELTHRLVVHDHSIRMRWTAKLWMRDPALDFIPGMGSVEAKLVYMCAPLPHPPYPLRGHESPATPPPCTCSLYCHLPGTYLSDPPLHLPSQGRRLGVRARRARLHPDPPPRERRDA